MHSNKNTQREEQERLQRLKEEKEGRIKSEKLYALKSDINKLIENAHQKGADLQQIKKNMVSAINKQVEIIQLVGDDLKESNPATKSILNDLFDSAEKIAELGQIAFFLLVKSNTNKATFNQEAKNINFQLNRLIQYFDEKTNIDKQTINSLRLKIHDARTSAEEKAFPKPHVASSDTELFTDLSGRVIDIDKNAAKPKAGLKPLHKPKPPTTQSTSQSSVPAVQTPKEETKQSIVQTNAQEAVQAQNAAPATPPETTPQKPPVEIEMKTFTGVPKKDESPKVEDTSAKTPEATATVDKPLTTQQATAAVDKPKTSEQASATVDTTQSPQAVQTPSHISKVSVVEVKDDSIPQAPDDAKKATIVLPSEILAEQARIATLRRLKEYEELKSLNDEIKLAAQDTSLTSKDLVDFVNFTKYKTILESIEKDLIEWKRHATNPEQETAQDKLNAFNQEFQAGKHKLEILFLERTLLGIAASSTPDIKQAQQHFEKIKPFLEAELKNAKDESETLNLSNRLIGIHLGMDKINGVTDSQVKLESLLKLKTEFSAFPNASIKRIDEELSQILLQRIRQQVVIIKSSAAKLEASYPQPLSAQDVEANLEAYKNVSLLFDQISKLSDNLDQSEAVRKQAADIYQNFKNTATDIENIKHFDQAFNVLEIEKQKLNDFSTKLNDQRQPNEKLLKVTALRQQLSEIKIDAALFNATLSYSQLSSGMQAKVKTQLETLKSEISTLSSQLILRMDSIELCQQGIKNLSECRERYEKYLTQIESKTPLTTQAIDQQAIPLSQEFVELKKAATSAAEDKALPPKYKDAANVIIAKQSQAFLDAQLALIHVRATVTKQIAESKDFDNFFQNYPEINEYLQHPQIKDALIKAWSIQACVKPSSTQLQELEQVLDLKKSASKKSEEFNFFRNKTNNVYETFIHIFFKNADANDSAKEMSKIIKSVHAFEIAKKGIQKGEEILGKANDAAKAQALKTQFDAIKREVVLRLEHDYIGNPIDILIKFNELEARWPIPHHEFKQNPDIALATHFQNKLSELNDLETQLFQCQQKATNPNVSTQDLRSIKSDLDTLTKSGEVTATNLESYAQQTVDPVLKKPLMQQAATAINTFKAKLATAKVDVETQIKKYSAPEDILSSAKNEIDKATESANKIKNNLASIYSDFASNNFQKVAGDLVTADQIASAISTQAIDQLIKNKMRPGDAKAITTEVQQIGQGIIKIKSDLQDLLSELSNLVNLPEPQKQAIADFNQAIVAFTSAKNLFDVKFNDLARHPEAILLRAHEAKPIAEQLNNAHAQITQINAVISAIAVPELQKEFAKKIGMVNKSKSEVDAKLKVLEETYQNMQVKAGTLEAQRILQSSEREAEIVRVQYKTIAHHIVLGDEKNAASSIQTVGGRAAKIDAKQINGIPLPPGKNLDNFKTKIENLQNELRSEIEALDGASKNQELGDFLSLLDELPKSIDIYTDYIDEILKKDIIEATEAKDNNAPNLLSDCDNKFTILENALKRVLPTLPTAVKEALQKRYEGVVTQEKTRMDEKSALYKNLYDKAKAGQFIGVIKSHLPHLDQIEQILEDKYEDIADHYRSKDIAKELESKLKDFQDNLSQPDEAYVATLINETFFPGKKVAEPTKAQAAQLYAESLFTVNLKLIEDLKPAPLNGYEHLLEYFERNKKDFYQYPDRGLESILNVLSDTDNLHHLERAFEQAGFREKISPKIIGELRFYKFMQDPLDEFKKPEYQAFTTLLNVSENFKAALIEHFATHTLTPDLLANCNKAIANHCSDICTTASTAKALSEVVKGTTKIRLDDIANPESLLHALRARALYSERFSNNTALNHLPVLKEILTDPQVKEAIMQTWEAKLLPLESTFDRLLTDLKSIENWGDLAEVSDVLSNHFGVKDLLNIKQPPIIQEDKNHRALFAEIQFQLIYNEINKDLSKGKLNFTFLKQRLDDPSFANALKIYISKPDIFANNNKIFEIIATLQSVDPYALKDLLKNIISGDVGLRIAQALYAANMAEEIRRNNIMTYVENPVLRDKLIDHGFDLGLRKPEEFASAFNSTKTDPVGFNVWMRREAELTVDDIVNNLKTFNPINFKLDEKEITESQENIKRLYKHFADNPNDIDEKNPDIPKPADKKGMVEWREHHAGKNTRYHNEVLRNLLIQKGYTLDSKDLKDLRNFSYEKDRAALLAELKKHDKNFDDTLFTPNDFAYVKFCSAIEYEPEHLQKIAVADLKKSHDRIQSLADSLDRLPKSPETAGTNIQLATKKQESKQLHDELTKFIEACDDNDIPISEAKGGYNRLETQKALIEKFGNASMLETVMQYGNLVKQQKALEAQIDLINQCQTKIESINKRSAAGMIQTTADRYKLGKRYEQFRQELLDNKAGLRVRSQTPGEHKALDEHHVDVLTTKPLSVLKDQLKITSRKVDDKIVVEAINSPFSAQCMAEKFAKTIFDSKYQNHFNIKGNPYNITTETDRKKQEVKLISFMIKYIEFAKKRFSDRFDQKAFIDYLTMMKGVDHSMDWGQIQYISAKLSEAFKDMTLQKETIFYKTIFGITTNEEREIHKAPLIETAVLTIHELLTKGGQLPANSTINIPIDVNPEITRVQILYLNHLNSQLPPDKQFKIDYDQRFHFDLSDKTVQNFQLQINKLTKAGSGSPLENLKNPFGYLYEKDVTQSAKARKDLLDLKKEENEDNYSATHRRNSNYF